MRMKKTALTLVALCLSGAGMVLAQSPDSKTESSSIPVILNALQGQWTLSVRFEPASGFPAGTEGKGLETWRAAVDGKVLLSEESWKAGPFDTSILGILWWDSRENKLHAMDCNNQGKSACDPKDAVESVVVNWTGTELTIDEPERGPGGKLVTSRVTFKDFKADSFTETDSLEVSPGKFETMMVIHAVRSGA